MSHFRHYIYGLARNPEHEDFLTTELSLENAISWAEKHSQQFRNRYYTYSIRLVDQEVSKFTPKD